MRIIIIWNYIGQVRVFRAPGVQSTDVLFILIVPTTSLSQDIYPVSGGASTHPDPANKNLIQMIAETPSYRLTVGRSEMKHKTARMIGIFLKIENLSKDSRISFKTSDFSMIDDKGEGYSGLETDQAIKRFQDTHAIALAVLTGPFADKAVQQKMGEEIRRMSLDSGDVMPGSFKQGIIFFEAPKKQHYTLKIKLGDLWPEPFVFSTEKPKSKK